MYRQCSPGGEEVPQLAGSPLFSTSCFKAMLCVGEIYGIMQQQQTPGTRAEGAYVYYGPKPAACPGGFLTAGV